MNANQEPHRAELMLPKPPPEAFGRGEHQTKSASPDDRRKREQKPDSSDSEPEDDERDGAPDTETRQGDKKEPESKPLYQRPVLMTVLIAIVVLGAAAGIGYWLYSRNYESTDDAFIDGHVVMMGPKVAAYVKDVKIDDNWPVKVGQVLVQLDPTDYQVALEQARAGLATAQGRLAEANATLQSSQAQVAQSQADLEVAKALADNAQRDFERFNALPDPARSRQQLDNATATQRQTAAQVTAAAAKVLAAQAQVTSAQKAIATANGDRAQAEAQVHQAQVNLSYCTLTAPTDGRITRKNVEPGSYVGVGQVLFSIVPTDVWVTANYKETQLKLMHPGQEVTISVDAFPQRKFRGRVDSIQSGTGSRFSLIPAENATGNYVKVVQRVPVKILFDEGELDPNKYLLAPGMSVEPKVRVRD